MPLATIAPPSTNLVTREAERAARATLRAQIARLEQRLALLTFELWEAGQPAAPDDAAAGGGAPRLLSLGELEQVRDALVARLDAAHGELRARSAEMARARARLETMLAEPHEHRYEILYHAELGERSCGAYHVLPRFGLLGMLFGWWCVKLSSGCP